MAYAVDLLIILVTLAGQEHHVIHPRSGSDQMGDRLTATEGR